MLKTHRLHRLSSLVLPLLLALSLLPLRSSAAEQIVLEAEDGRRIAAELHLPQASGKKRPAVLLIHQGGSDRGEWAPYIPPMVARGYVVLAFDVRGHGESGEVEDLYALFNDPRQAPLDLDAAITFLRDHPAVDELRIAVVGSSIGANLAVVANHHYGLPGVAISGKTSAARNLAGVSSQLELRGLFYLSSAGDQDGKRAEWAREMHALTLEPRQVWIVEGSTGHGVTLFEESPVSFERVLRWLKERL